MYNSLNPKPGYPTTFEIRARDTTGATRTLTREAASRAELLSSFRAERLLVLSVEEVKGSEKGTSFSGVSWLRPMTDFDVEMGLRQMASMLRSGITLLAAVRTVAEESLSPWAARVWYRVAEALFRGSAFSAALSAEKNRFDEIVIRLAEIGERSGELADAMAKGADQLEARRNLRTQVVNALVYPLLAIVMALGVSAFLVIAVIPKIGEFLQAGGTELPAMTASLVDFSAWLTANAFHVLGAALGALAAWFFLRLTAVGRELEDALLLRVPITGRILRLSGTALFARSMAIMTTAGVTLLDALGTAAELLVNRRLRRRVRTARDRVMRGTTLAEGLEDARELMPMLRRMAAVGEVSGALPETFGETARFHEMLLALSVKRFGMLIEPVMIVVTGLIVGYVYIAFFLAIFAMAGAS